ncbi:hypothetical protein MUN82_19840 [Hymenobacter aerilatus]|uniref:Uncharacterized protein n=1 Tax=Hymenobacter aerilatus TaxID=2932251 RepID=A0A8T9SZC2_9BACT|nr:hypothetical protein [Hymenobacter aerilatus]UOR05176.1 hypothetical protein MUN82_19840 [Hymenobacter aerilatus]
MPLRLVLCVCTFLGAGFFCADNQPAQATTPAPVAVQWELRLLDGQPVSRHHRYLDKALLPTLPASTAPAKATPRTGACLPSFGTQLAGTMRLIITMLEADNSALDFGLRYLSLLHDVRTYELHGNQLCLYDADRLAPRLVFVAASPSS